jgi:hypothetical protein
MDMITVEAVVGWVEEVLGRPKTALAVEKAMLLPCSF